MEKQTKRKPTGAAALGAGPGRHKGVPNKNSTQLKDMILTALSNAGGAEYLEARANDPKTAGSFLALIGKVLPMTVIGAGEDGAHVFVSIERTIVRPKD